MDEQSPDLHLPADDQVRDLRPRTLAACVGQEQIRENLRVYIAAAKQREEALDHVLFHGPPGLGKTTLARIVARELGVNFQITAGPALDKQGDLAAMLTTIQEHDVFFIDEIHRLSRSLAEVLYPAMEDFALDLVLGKGPGARAVRLDLPHFTLIGATTRLGALTSPFRDRFGIVCRLELYNLAELGAIIEKNAATLEVSITAEGITAIAARSRGTPRVANRLLRRVRDFSQVQNCTIVDEGMAKQALDKMHVDPLGLELNDHRFLRVVRDRFAGGPVGVAALAAALGEDVNTLAEVYEPYLLQVGLLERTPRGRRLTDYGRQHLEEAAHFYVVSDHRTES